MQQGEQASEIATNGNSTDAESACGEHKAECHASQVSSFNVVGQMC